jgi:hypothetical protein
MLLACSKRQGDGGQIAMTVTVTVTVTGGSARPNLHHGTFGIIPDQEKSTPPWGRCAVIWRHFIANDVLMQLSFKEDSADPPSVLLV